MITSLAHPPTTGEPIVEPVNGFIKYTRAAEAASNGAAGGFMSPMLLPGVTGGADSGTMVSGRDKPGSLLRST